METLLCSLYYADYEHNAKYIHNRALVIKGSIMLKMTNKIIDKITLP